MQMEITRKYYLTYLWIAVAFQLVAALNLFPFTISLNGVDLSEVQSGVSTDLSELVYNLEHPSVTLDYFSILGYNILNGAKGILAAFFLVLNGTGIIMYSLGIPWFICALVQIPITSMIAFELYQTLFR